MMVSSLSISGASITEGDGAGTVNLDFTVTLSPADPVQTVMVNFRTSTTAENIAQFANPATANINIVIGATGSFVGNSASRAARLNVFGGPPRTSNSWNSAVKIQTASAIGWDGSGEFSFGIGPSTGGLYFFRAQSFKSEAQAPKPSTI